MKFKLFTDLIDALGKVASRRKAIVNLPKAERETMRQTLDETYRRVDTTLNMVIIRLGDLLLHGAYDDFLHEARESVECRTRENETKETKLRCVT